MNLKRLLASLGMLIVLAIAWPQAGSAGAKIDDPVDPSITDGSAAKALSEARSAWKSTGIRKYRFTIRASCFCAFIDPVKVEVRGHKVKLSNPDWFGPKNVPAMFKFIGQAINRKAAVLQVRYRKNGVPRQISVDYSFRIADEEMAYSITKFSRIRAK